MNNSPEPVSQPASSPTRLWSPLILTMLVAVLGTAAWTVVLTARQVPSLPVLIVFLATTVVFVMALTRRQRQSLERRSQNDVINERKQAGLDLQNSLSQLRATLDSTADGILVVNTAGKIINYNRQFVELWQIPEATLATWQDAKVIDCLLYTSPSPRD